MESKVRPVRMADKFTASPPSVKEARILPTLWVSTATYKDNFTNRLRLCYCTRQGQCSVHFTISIGLSPGSILSRSPLKVADVSEENVSSSFRSEAYVKQQKDNKQTGSNSIELSPKLRLIFSELHYRCENLKFSNFAVRCGIL
jgi:hypothetical protein